MLLQFAPCCGQKTQRAKSLRSHFAGRKTANLVPRDPRRICRLAANSNEGMGTATAPPPTSTAVNSREKQKQVEDLKLQLLSIVASLDRGLAATVTEAENVELAVQALERAGGPVTLSWAPMGDSTLDLLQGTWRLLYTSGFNTGSLGGTRPGPPAALVPTTLGQVYQVIDGAQARLDNCVEFLFTVGLPFPPLSSLMGSGEAESPAVRLTLKHDYQILGSCTVQITFEDTTAELLGSSLFSQLPKLNFPNLLPDFLKPSRDLRSANFDVVFLDQTMRVTRGDRGELRIYIRDHSPNAPGHGMQKRSGAIARVGQLVEDDE